MLRKLYSLLAGLALPLVFIAAVLSLVAAITKKSLGDNENE